MPSRIALIINPTSGKGTGATMGVATAHLLRSAGHQVIDVSAGSYELSRAGAATALADGVDTLVVVGGDGMVHLGVNLCAGTPVRLGVVAAGTGNDFARNLD
ncbi:MAG: acylglycerol kinase family protein, partial [Terracoccus sp.]